MPGHVSGVWEVKTLSHVTIFRINMAFLYPDVVADAALLDSQGGDEERIVVCVVVCCTTDGKRTKDSDSHC